jgi:hypothetical protein
VIITYQSCPRELAEVEVECAGFFGTLKRLYMSGWKLQIRGTGVPTKAKVIKTPYNENQKNDCGTDAYVEEVVRDYPRTKIRLINKSLGLVAGSVNCNVPFVAENSEQNFPKNYTHSFLLPFSTSFSTSTATSLPSMRFPHIGYIKNFDRDRRFNLVSVPSEAFETKIVHRILAPPVIKTTDLSALGEQDLPVLYDKIIEIQRRSADEARAYTEKQKALREGSNSVRMGIK